MPHARRWTPSRVRAQLWPSLARPIFVVGSPRSGTTFLGECLEAVPEISYHYEPLLTQWLARERGRLGWSARTERALHRGTYRWLLRIHGEGDLRFAEKTPRNSFSVLQLAEWFPDASFVHIVRDGRDVALSLLRLPWFRADAGGAGADGGGFGPHARFWVEPERRDEFERVSDLRRCIWCWRRYTEAVLDAFQELPPERTHTLRYEDWVLEGKGAADALLGALAIEGEGARAALHAAVAGSRASSVGAWRERLDADGRAEIASEAGALLARLGYDDRGAGLGAGS